MEAVALPAPGVGGSACCSGGTPGSGRAPSSGSYECAPSVPVEMNQDKIFRPEFTVGTDAR